MRFGEGDRRRTDRLPATDARIALPEPRSGHGLAAFFLLTFTFTWTVWLAAGAIPERGAPEGSALSLLRAPLFLLGVFGPAIVALAVTARSTGRDGVAALVGRIGRWRHDARWYLFAIGYLAAVKLAAAVLHRLVFLAWPRFGDAPWALIAAALLLSTWVQAGEEIGWRGFALPRLVERFGLVTASLLLGPIWAAWHLPLHLSPQGDLYGQSFTVYALQVTAISVAMAWLFWRTSGGLLPVMLFHAAVNNTTAIVPSAVIDPSETLLLGATRMAWLTAGLLWLTAIYFLVRMRGVQRLP